MKKFYLVNGDTLEVAYYPSSAEAFEETVKRNRYDKHANWKAYNDRGDAVYGIVYIQ